MIARLPKISNALKNKKGERPEQSSLRTLKVPLSCPFWLSFGSVFHGRERKGRDAARATLQLVEIFSPAYKIVKPEGVGMRWGKEPLRAPVLTAGCAAGKIARL